jgi:integrase
MVKRHAIVLNPALSVRGERYSVMEGKTPEIPIPDARKLLASMDTSHVIGLRDRAILAVLVYTGSRAGAVAKLKYGDFYPPTLPGRVTPDRVLASGETDLDASSDGCMLLI